MARYSRNHVRHGAGSTAARSAGIGPEALWLGSIASLLVFAGSLTPFRFDRLNDWAGGWVCLGRIGWPPVSREDVIVNLLVYIPIGFALCGWVRRIVPRGAPAVATLLAAGISLAIEAAQTLTSARFASWVDVSLNTYGACLGAVMAPFVASRADRAVGRIRAAFERNPFVVLAAAVTIGVIIHGSAPFDFVTNDQAFRDSLTGSQWWPIAERFSSPAGLGAANGWQPILSILGVAGAFALMAGVQGLANRRGGMDSSMAIAAASGHAVLVAVVVEILQLFIRSRTFDTYDVAVNATAGVCGAWFAVAILGGLCRWRLSRSHRTVLARVVVVAILLQMVFGMACAVAPFDAFGSSFDAGTANWIPFAAVFRMPFASAMGRLTSFMLAVTLLATTVALHQRLCVGRVRWSVAAMVVVAVALVCELAQCWAPARTTDLTEPVLAAVTVVGCAWVHRWFRRHTPISTTGDQRRAAPARVTAIRR